MLTNKAPTFLLKNIDPSELHKKYASGCFNRPIPTKVKLNSQSVNTKSSLQNEQKTRTVKFITSNNVAMQKFVKNNNQNVCGGRCYYCLQDFEHSSVGYPINYEPHYYLDKNDVYKVDHLFWVVDHFCRYECCLAYLENFNHADTFHQDAILLLKLMHKLEYGDKELRSAPDFRLLEANGGSLSIEEWRGEQFHYVKTNNVIKIPTQVIYAKQQL